MDYTPLGQRIKKERLKLNLTQSQLAEDVDISDAYVGLGGIPLQKRVIKPKGETWE